MRGLLTTTIIVSIFVGLTAAGFVEAGTVISTSTVTISAMVVAPYVPPPSGGGGGGGVYTPPAPVETRVIFSGVAYPMSRIIVIKNAVQTVSSLAGPDGVFNINLSNLEAGWINFLLYAEDETNHRSASYSLPIFISAGAITTVSGIFLSPTIALDKDAVNQGATITVFGQSAPNSKVTITVNSATQANFEVRADPSGYYRYMLDTKPLEIGEHQSRSRATLNNMISPYSSDVYFRVVKPGESLPTRPVSGSSVGSFKSGAAACDVIADLNKDCKVNLVDFSILSYWYKRAKVPSNIDLNKDKKVTLADFSIMAYHWKP